MVSVIGLVLMVVSNATSWFMITTSKSSSSLIPLRSSVWKISLFYTLWALYNKYPGGRSQELGHVSMGLLTLCCLSTMHCCSFDGDGRSGNVDAGNAKWNRHPLATKLPLLLSTALVVLNFAVVVPLIVLAKGPAGIAKKVWKGDTSALAVAWGYTFVAYILSNVGMWSLVLYEFYQLPVDGGGDASSAGTTDPTIQETIYEPLQTDDL
eukprot:CAMPEP_0168190148 /NCGR_PEP_ID=MMETSP0139_2-20121125/16752_1 /TAXON_ID=44445 /ORGANISM="Pseudo-nitzschia australis, Strain 10249 10 AB" /LENGTH=208 /DNA_ID=CAMNT_0008113085 /DNA_START=183 /DNA_END=809 /DNA_ORIENTATION=-